MATDKKTIGVTLSNAAGLLALTAAGHFASELDAAKFAMAHAIKCGVQPGAAESTETKWNVGSVDPDGSLRSLVEALFPDVTEPYRAAEFLINEGIRALVGPSGGTKDMYATLFPDPAAA
jgi:hypothetical protein